MYSQLIESQWKYTDIDNMDFHGFLRLMSKSNGKTSKNKKPSNSIEDFYNAI